MGDHGFTEEQLRQAFGPSPELEKLLLQPQVQEALRQVKTSAMAACVLIAEAYWDQQDQDGSQPHPSEPMVLGMLAAEVTDKAALAGRRLAMSAGVGPEHLAKGREMSDLSERDLMWNEAVNEDAEKPDGEHLGIIRVLQEQDAAELARLRAELVKADQRLTRIGRAHSKNVGAGGLTSGLCIECGESDPCPTKIWATTDRHPLAVWDPADEDETTRWDSNEL
jgi:hypothetical protein